MAPDLQQVSHEIRQALLARLGEKVDLIFYFGSRLKSTTHRYSDLDMCYVPVHPTTWDSITVMVGEILFDLFPMQWSHLENLSQMSEPNASILLSNVVVYQRTQEAGERFAGLSARLRSLHEPAARAEMLKRALDLFQKVGYQFYLLQTQADSGHLASCIHHSQRILHSVLHVLAVCNQQCVDTRKMDQVLALPRLPEGLASVVDQLTAANTPSAILAACRKLLDITRAMLLSQQREVLVGQSSLPAACGAMYPEMKADLQKVLIGCERQDVLLISRRLMSVYHELSLHLAKGLTGVEYGEFNTLVDYEQDLGSWAFPPLVPYLAARDFAGLHEQCLRFDRHLRAFLTERGVGLYDFASLDELRPHLAIGRA
jgi:hypothetical protein